MSLFYFPGQRKRDEAMHAQDMARQQAQIDANRALQERALNQANVDEVYKQKALTEAIRNVIAKENPGFSPEQIDAETNYRYSQSVASQPMASSAIADYTKELYGGMKAGAGELGGVRTKADIDSEMARGTSAFNTTNANLAVADLYPNQMAEATKAATNISRRAGQAAEIGLGTDKFTLPATAGSEESSAIRKRAEDQLAVTTTDNIDPLRAANAANKTAEAQAVTADAVTNLKGLPMEQLLSSPMIWADPRFQAAMQRLLVNFMNQKNATNKTNPGSTNPGAIDLRGTAAPAFNLNSLRGNTPY